MKAREIDCIERAIQFYGCMATRWRGQGVTVMAGKMDAHVTVERERLALAIAERDAWPPVVDRP